MTFAATPLVLTPFVRNQRLLVDQDEMAQYSRMLRWKPPQYDVVIDSYNYITVKLSSQAIRAQYSIVQYSIVEYSIS